MSLAMERLLMGSEMARLLRCDKMAADLLSILERKDESSMKGGGQMKQQSPQERYDTKNTVKVCLKLNQKHDADILSALEASGNKQGYIKSLIRADLAKRNRK